MTKDELQNNSFVVNINNSIQDAMGAITDNQRGTVVVVGDDLTFHGVVSDGDIRRALLKGATQLTPLSKIINMSARTVTEAEAKEGVVDEIFQKDNSVNLLPVVNDKNILVDVAVRNPKERKDI